MIPLDAPSAGCERQEGNTNGAVRLRGGSGTLCDPVYSGFIEILNKGEWGSICTRRFSEIEAEDKLVADVVCRQLGFPHGTRVDPLVATTTVDLDTTPPASRFRPFFGINADPEEAEEPVELFWLYGYDVRCAGPEQNLVDCDLGLGFRRNPGECESDSHRIYAACRQFPVVEAFEEITTPGAGAYCSETWGCLQSGNLNLEFVDFL